MVVLDKIHRQSHSIELIGPENFHEKSALILENFLLQNHQTIEMAGGDFDLHGLILRIDFNLSVYTKNGQSQAEFVTA
jgi:hypothetical protein